MDMTKPFEVVMQKIAEDSLLILKIIAPILLVVSFIIVAIGWSNLNDSSTLMQSIKTTLAVPLILFAVVAIINIMLFTQPGASMFLAIFFIGTIVSGPELAEKGAKIAASTLAAPASEYMEALGGIGSSNYATGGIEEKELANSDKPGAEKVKTENPKTINP